MVMLVRELLRVRLLVWEREVERGGVKGSRRVLRGVR